MLSGKCLACNQSPRTCRYIATTSGALLLSVSFASGASLYNVVFGRSTISEGDIFLTRSRKIAKEIRRSAGQREEEVRHLFVQKIKRTKTTLRLPGPLPTMVVTETESAKSAQRLQCGRAMVRNYAEGFWTGSVAQCNLTRKRAPLVHVSICEAGLSGGQCSWGSKRRRWN